MADKKISDFAQLPDDLQASDKILLQRGSTYYWVDAPDLGNHLDTDDIDEGSSNLYYTNARFNTQFATRTTSSLTEGSNLYWTTARGNSNFDTRFATKTSADLAESASNEFNKFIKTTSISIPHAQILLLGATPLQLLTGGGEDLEIISVHGYFDNAGTTAYTSNDLEIYVDGIGEVMFTSEGADLNTTDSISIWFGPANTTGTKNAPLGDLYLSTASNVNPSGGHSSNKLKLDIVYRTIDWSLVS